MISGENKRYSSLLLLVLALVTAVLYWPVHTHDFINYDDPDYVTDNAHVRDGFSKSGIIWAFTKFTGEPTYWHPLTWLSHMFDCHVFGVASGPHHLMNVLFHALNAVLLFLLLNRMTGSLWRSLLVSGIFAWHPLQTDTVAWVSERKNLLSTCFVLLTLLAYTRYASRPCTKRYAVVFLLFCGSLMAKPAAVIVPCLLLVLDYWPLRRYGAGVVATKGPVSNAKRLVLEKLPLLVPVAFSCVVTIQAHQSINNLYHLPLSARLSNAVVSYLRYVGKTIWPTDLAIYYPHPGAWPGWLVICAVVFLLVVSGLVLKSAKSRPYLITGWCWFLGALFPTIGIVQAGTQAMADRFNYFPVIGLFIMIVWGAGDVAMLFPRARVLRTLLVAVPVCCLLPLTRAQVGYWKNSITVFEHCLKAVGENPLAHDNIGRALALHGELDRAVEHHKAALAVDTNDWLAFYNLAAICRKQGKLEDARTHIDQSLKINPAYPHAHYELAKLLTVANCPDQAANEFHEVLRLSPGHPEALSGLAGLLQAKGLTNEAVTHLEQALSAAPDYCPARAQLAALLIRSGQRMEGLQQYRAILKVNPDWMEILNNVAWILATDPDEKIRNATEAVQMAERVCELSKFNQPGYLDTLAAAYAEAGQFERARQTIEKAISLVETSGNSDFSRKYKERRDLYLRSKPYRE